MHAYKDIPSGNSAASHKKYFFVSESAGEAQRLSPGVKETATHFKATRQARRYGMPRDIDRHSKALMDRLRGFSLW